MATLSAIELQVLWSASQRAGTARPRVLRTSGARKAVVAVAGEATGPTYFAPSPNVPAVKSVIVHGTPCSLCNISFVPFEGTQFCVSHSNPLDASL